MERQIILDTLAATLNSLPEVRKQAELQLQEFEKQPGFTVYCLKLAVDDSVTQSQRSSAAVFFKNRIINHWNTNKERGIGMSEQEQIKVEIIQALLKVHDDTIIRSQLTATIRNILLRGNWTLHEPIVKLLTSQTNKVHVFVGLLLLFEVTRFLRYLANDRALIDSYIDNTFPLLETLASEVIKTEGYFPANMLYLILKIFKYSALSALPQYLNDYSKLSTWISIHLIVIQRPMEAKVMELDPDDRSLDLRVKCYKWGFANLHKFYQRFCVPKPRNVASEFVEYFDKTHVPEILRVYYIIADKWIRGLWLSDNCLYHFISFFEKCFITTAWEYVKDQYDAILRHLVFPCLCQKNLELFENDPEEYIRRYFDVNRESSTADVAAVDTLFVTVHHRFEVLPSILKLLEEVFGEYNRDSSLENALKVEGGLRVISSISIALEKEGSPVRDQIDQIVDNFIAPHLTSQYEFLRARSCETISIISYDYQDKNVLSKVFEGVYNNFKNDDNLPIQIEAADALRVLLTDKLVTDAISSDVPAIMQKLLNLSKSYELDMIGEVMEAFVKTFHAQLEPFAVDLGSSLCDQFVRTAAEFLETSYKSNNRGDLADTDKEYQAVGYINTMSTMTSAMPTVNLETVFAPTIKFVLSNAALPFLGETLELLENLTMRAKEITPVVWELYKEAIDSFQTFAVEYFEYYVPFLENTITYGFKGLNSSSPEVVLLNDVIKALISADVDLDNKGAFELVQYLILVLGEFNENFPTILKIFARDNVSPVPTVKVLLASLLRDPTQTFQVLESTGETVRLFDVWFTIDTALDNVYGLKLQCLALLSILSLPQLPASLQESIPYLTGKLAFKIEKLPDAMKKRQESLNGSTEKLGLEESVDDYDDIDDAFKDTPLDEINVFVELKNKLHEIQNNLPERYQTIVGSLGQEKLESIDRIISMVSK